MRPAGGSLSNLLDKLCLSSGEGAAPLSKPARRRDGWASILPPQRPPTGLARGQDRPPLGGSVPGLDRGVSKGAAPLRPLDVTKLRPSGLDHSGARVWHKPISTPSLASRGPSLASRGSACSSPAPLLRPVLTATPATLRPFVWRAGGGGVSVALDPTLSKMALGARQRPLGAQRGQKSPPRPNTPPEALCGPLSRSPPAPRVRKGATSAPPPSHSQQIQRQPQAQVLGGFAVRFFS